MMNTCQRLAAILAVMFCCAAALGAERPTLEGEWVLVPQASTEIDLYGTLSVKISRTDGGLTLVRTFGGGRSLVDTLTLKTGGTANQVAVLDRVFPTNVFMGLSMDEGSRRTVKAFWVEAPSHLRLEETFDVLASQGKIPFRCEHVFRAGPSPDLMTYTITRSTREVPLTYTLKRKGSREACYMALEDAWTVGAGLEKQAFLISLQGNANREAANLYFVYPKTWDFNYTPHVFDFYRDKKFYSFRRLSTVEQALQTFKSSVKATIREVLTSGSQTT